MNSVELILLNFEEIRRRSIKLWGGVPEKLFTWRPDHLAMNCIEMVRHVLEGEDAYHEIILHKGSQFEYKSPWEGRIYTTIADELAFAEPYRERFLETIKLFSENDLAQTQIVRSELGQVRNLGDFMLRVAYHEATHAGQMLSYLRTLNIPRPDIWD
jgi:uncharacterized damage-inducible protein DinB